MELACAMGSSKLDSSVVLELDTDVVLALVMVNVVKATKEPVEVAELVVTLGEVLEIKELVGELLELEDVMGRVLEELLGLENGLASEDAVNELLRVEEELAGTCCSCGCGCSCLNGPVTLAVGTTRDV